MFYTVLYLYIKYFMYVCNMYSFFHRPSLRMVFLMHLFIITIKHKQIINTTETIKVLYSEPICNQDF
jgi:hypothetical protein